MQKRLLDTGWSDESKCQGCCKEGTDFTIAQAGVESDVGFQRLSESWNKKRETSEKEWKWQSSTVGAPSKGKVNGTEAISA